MTSLVTFGLDDVAIIDWHAALLFDREADDVRAVLTFANVELLEMRYLDEQWTCSHDTGYPYNADFGHIFSHN
jgi:hypothetical protein